jgi:flagellar capping protein FliD
MSASTKLRITTNQRKVLKLEAQQEAYRSIIGKFNSFRDKYFDILNGQTNLRSRSTFNRHQAKIMQGGLERNISGVSVNANATATPGNYKIKIESTATQAKITSNTMDSLNPDFDLSQYADGATRAMSVTVGGTTRWISFKGDTDAEVRESLNEALQVFGRMNNTDTTGKGRVYFCDDDSVFKATDKAPISTGAVTELTNTVNLGALADMKTGNNSITLVIDGQTRTVNFQTVKEDYFSDLSFVQGADGTWQTIGGTQESRNAFNAIVQEMYDKQRSEAFDAWFDSADRNENHNRVALTRQQRVDALASVGIGGFGGLTDQQIDDRIAEIISNDNTNTTQRNAARNALTNALNAEALSIRVAGLTAAGFNLTGVDTANATAVNTFINANEGARAAADNATFMHIYNNQMTQAQRDLFDSEVERRNAATRQTEFDRAVTALYNQFDTWQRAVVGSSRVDNPAFNPLLPASEANPPQINNPEYLFFEQWRDMIGLTGTDVENLYLTHGNDWAENISFDMTDLNAHFSSHLAALTPGSGLTQARIDELRATDFTTITEERFETAGENAYKGKIYEEYRLGFLQGGYSERAAFFNNYNNGTAPGADTGESLSNFIQENVLGITSAAAFGFAERRDALVAGGFISAAAALAWTTDADIDAFLASSAMSASDASRYHEALLAQRTAAIDAGNGTTTHNGLTTYERIAALQSAGITIPNSLNALSHDDITAFIAGLSTTDAVTNAQGHVTTPSSAARAEAALLAARNAKISAAVRNASEAERQDALDAAGVELDDVELTNAQKIAALNAAGISHELTNASTTAAINNFINALTGDDEDKWDTAEFNAKVANISRATDRAKAGAAIEEARKTHFDAIPKNPQAGFSPDEIARYFNDNSIENILNNIVFADGTKVEAVVVSLTDEEKIDGLTSLGITHTLNSSSTSQEINDFINALTGADADDWKDFEQSMGVGELILTAYREDEDGNRLPADVPMGVIANSGSENTFGSPEQNTTVSSITQATRLGELGLNHASYNFTVNGVNFSFGANATIREMLTAVNNNAAANVEMTFSTLTNSFEIRSKQYGADSELSLGLGNLLGALGFTGAADQRTAGENMVMFIDGKRIETADSSYTFNGIEINVARNTVIPQDGLEFEISVGRDTSELFDIIKSFVDDYNALIDYVFGYVSEPPDREFYFLTDTDREELQLSDRQEQRWEERARKGLLYNDRTIISLMSTMRTAMFSGVDRGLGDGSMFGLFSMGITTSDNWKQNGKLVLNEQRLRAAIDNDIDAVTRLFTDAENGIMPKLFNTINSAVRSTGERWERGLLVQRAGVAGGTSATSNALYDQIKRLNSVISNLEVRYQRQQDRYWKIFSGLETQMGQLNSQHDFISQMGTSNLWGGSGR